MRVFAWVPLMLFWGLSMAADSPVFQRSVEGPVTDVYSRVYEALETRKMWVVFEADIGANLERMAGRLGDDYNRNELDALRTMVVCNAFYANAVSNADPDMLALCPLRVVVTHKDGVSKVLFARPTVIAAGSPALGIVREIEDLVIAAIEEATAQ